MAEKIVDKEELAQQKIREEDFKKPLRRRAFTWFNYTEENVEYLRNIGQDKVDYLIFGFELCKDNKKHLQGYVEFSKAISGVQSKLRLDPFLGKKSPISFGKLNKTSQANIYYCKKDESSDPEAVEKYGVKYFEICFIKKQQGKRTDWHEIHDKIVKDGADFCEVAEAFPEQAIKCYGGIDRLIRATEEKAQWNEFVSQFEGVTLRPWQARLVKELEFQAGDRKIIWIYETIGNVGKSWLSKYLVARHKACRFENGKTGDIALAYKNEPIVVFDFSRTVEDRLNYGAIESLINGAMFSGKYQSCGKYFKSPHMVCFANWPPNLNTVSGDRWDVRRLNKDQSMTKRLVQGEPGSLTFVVESDSLQPLAHTCNTESEILNEVWSSKENDNIAEDFSDEIDDVEVPKMTWFIDDL